MRGSVELVAFFVTFGAAYRLGKMEMARFVWNLLANNRSADMAEAVCLYCASLNHNILLKNGWKKVDDAYRALRSRKELIDSI